MPHVTLFFAGKAGEDLGQVLLWVDVRQGTTLGENPRSKKAYNQRQNHPHIEKERVLANSLCVRSKRPIVAYQL